jgi:hypothetical protein
MDVALNAKNDIADANQSGRCQPEFVAPQVCSAAIAVSHTGLP